MSRSQPSSPVLPHYTYNLADLLLVTASTGDADRGC